MEFVLGKHAAGFQTPVRPRYHGRTSLPPPISLVLEFSPALHYRIPRPAAQLCSPGAMGSGAPLRPQVAQSPWALESPYVNLPTSGMFSRYPLHNHAPQPRTVTHNSWARLSKCPRDPLTATAVAFLCPSLSPRNPSLGPISRNPRPRALGAASHYSRSRSPEAIWN